MMYYFGIGNVQDSQQTDTDTSQLLPAPSSSVLTTQFLSPTLPCYSVQLSTVEYSSVQLNTYQYSTVQLSRVELSALALLYTLCALAPY